jgi:hypothetical protein
MTHATTGTHTLRVYNNSVSEITSAYTGAATTARTLKGIFVSGTGGTTTQTYEFYNNSVSIDGSASLNVSSSCFEVNTTTGPVFKLGNNIFANLTGAQTTARHYVMVSTSATQLGNTGTTCNNNDYYLANDAGVSGFVGLGSATTYTALSNWQAAMTGLDAASLSVNPSYLNNTSDLHATALALNGAGMAPPAYVTNDLDCAARTPDNDLGAYIINACSGIPTAGSISGITTICSGSSTTLTLTGASTGAGITYQWASSTTNGGPYTTLLGTSTTQVTGPVTVTTYYVVGVACSVSGQAVTTAQYTLTVNPLPTVAVTPTTSNLCLPGGSPVALTASGASTYSWGPSTGLSATTGSSVTGSPSATTTYTVSGTDANGCVNTATTIINIGAQPAITSVTATPPAVCSGGNSQLAVSASVNSLVNTYSFAASTGATLDPMTGSTSLIGANDDDTPNASPVAIGFTFPYNGSTYTQFSVSPDGWLLLGSTAAVNQFTNSVTSTTNMPKIFPYWDDLATGTTGSVSYLVTGTAPNRILKVQWFVTSPRNTVGAANATFQAWLYETSGIIEFRYGTLAASGSASVGINGSATNYQSVTVTSNTSSISTPNDANAAAPASGQMYTFTPPMPSTFAWSPATFLSSTTISNPMANAVTATTTYTVTASQGFCSTTGTVTITAGSPLTGTATASPSATACAGSNVTLNANPTGGGAPYTYAWTGPNSFTATSQNPVVSGVTAASAGTYTCVITDNCASTFTVTVALTVNPLPTVTATPSTATYCTPGSPVALVASGATSYTWSPASGLDVSTGANVNASPSSSTTYTITGTDANGCTSTTTAAVTVSEAPSISSVTATPATVCAGSNSQLNVAAGTTSAYTASVRTFATEPCQSNAGPTGDDNMSAVLPIGFSFNYYGVSYTQFAISTNGNIQLGDGTGSANNPAYSTSWTDVAIPNGGIPNNMIALAWDDWFISAGEITYGMTGSAPNRKMIICYNTTGRGSGSADTLVGQIVLEETTNAIYLNLTKKGVQPANTATQGIENQTGSAGSVAVLGRNNQAWSGNNNSIVFTPSGGSLSYAWSPSTFLSSSTISNPVATAINTSTTYTVSATSSGCTTTGTVSITVNNLPVVALSGNSTICAGDSTLLTGSSGGSSQWYLNGVAIPGATTNQYYASAAGVYNMTKTNLNGCTDSAAVGITVVVNALPAVTATASATSVCAGTNVTFTGSGASSYTWSGGVVDATPFAVTTSGYYVVTGTDANSCSAMDSVMVTVNANPVVALGNDSALCDGSLLLDAGNAGASFLWNDASSNQTLAANTTGTYYVTVTDGNGCVGSDTIVVTINNLPVVALGNDTSLCSNGLVLDAGNAGASYLWNDASVNQTLAVSTSGTYYVTVTDPSGCAASDTITLTLNPAPVVALGADTALCSGTVVLDAGNPGDSYLWSDNTINQTVTASTTGIYWVDVTNSNGCTSRDSITVTINSLPVVALGADTTVCGGPFTLDAGTSGDTYLWNDNSNGQTLSVSASGTCYVDVTNSTTGCASSDTIMVTINTPPTVTFLMQDTACTTDPAFALSGSPAGGTFSGPGVSGSAFNAATAGIGTWTVTYDYTDANGCSAQASQTIVVSACVGIDENGLPVASVYPNPNLGQFTVDLGFTPAAPVTVEITNALGQVVEAFQMTSNAKQVDLGVYEGGVYFVKITNGTSVSVVRVVKQ